MGVYSITWNEFETNVRQYFKQLRKDQKLFDVILATDDGQHVQAHKVILSAGSQFFSDLFMKIDHTDILVYLKGIRRFDVENIINFLYNGEASVMQDQLGQFLETAKELQVKGLQGDSVGIREQPTTAEEHVDEKFNDVDENSHHINEVLVKSEDVLIDDPEETLDFKSNEHSDRPIISNGNSDKKLLIKSEGRLRKNIFSDNEKDMFVNILKTSENGYFWKVLVEDSESSSITEKHDVWVKVAKLFSEVTKKSIDVLHARKLWSRMHSKARKAGKSF